MAFTHNSTVAEREPDWGAVDKTRLPAIAHAIVGDRDKKTTWGYPHHWIQNAGGLNDAGVYTTGTMFLHKGGLGAASAAAMGARTGQKAPASVIDHLNQHRRALDLEVLEKMTPNDLNDELAKGATAEMKPIPFDAELTLIKKFEDEKGAFHVVGLAATSDFDLQGDVISDEALKASENDLIDNSTMLFNHDDFMPIGKIKKSKLDRRGLLIDAIIDKDAHMPDTGTNFIDAIKQGILNKFSIRAQVLEAVREVVEDIGKVANVIKRMHLVECSLVSVPANPEAKTLTYYVSKAIGEHEMNNKTQKIDEKTGKPILDDVTKAAEAAAAAQAALAAAKGDKDKGTVAKGFPAPDVLHTEWGEFCREKSLNVTSTVEDIGAGWDAFCKAKGYPEGFAYPYLTKANTAVNDALMIVEALIKGVKADEIKTLAETLKTLLAPLAEKSLPFPGMKSEVAVEGEDDPSKANKGDNDQSGLIARLEEKTKKLEANIAELTKKADAKVVQKNLVKTDEEAAAEQQTVEKKLDEELKDKDPTAQLKILIEKQGPPRE